MKLITPTVHKRLNEAAGVVYLALAVMMWLSLISYEPLDPSWNTASSHLRAHNLIGPVGSYFADLCYQSFGLAALILPVLFCMLSWKWIRSERVESPAVRVGGFGLLVMSLCTVLALVLPIRLFEGNIAMGGLLGTVLSSMTVASFNLTGAIVVSFTCLIVSVYLATTFSFRQLVFLGRWLLFMLRPFVWMGGALQRWQQSLARKRLEARERRKEQERLRAEEERQERERIEQERLQARSRRSRQQRDAEPSVTPAPSGSASGPADDDAPWDSEDIPIRTLADSAPVPARGEQFINHPEEAPPPNAIPLTEVAKAKPKGPVQYRLPSTALLNEVPGRSGYDELELKEVALRIKAKFEEFNVRGSVVQINPGPVVTTFEYKPEAGVKYSRITTLTEDLCLGLQAESILIERIPGKPTVGIEVPNSKREIISLRQILESDEFRDSASHITMSLGKDINGRIKVASLETMPHLLIAGSTGSGKSVMLNSLIMSMLFKSTPEQVRMILVDPKRLEMGLYEGVPHLLTPVITDAKKATYALKNAVLEMERRLRLLASQGVRNIDQFNKKMRQLHGKSLSLFDEQEMPAEDLQPLPYIVIIIDELADLMMLERANVEESVTRLAQMARAVGMHLVLATQRPSVDVITGLIKANFPARISFRVATRVDSRTILDVMGSEHLLGKGDMLFLPPGSSRLTRVHGAFVTEAETNRVVDFWKEQARPDYDQSFLTAPPTDEEDAGDEEFSGEQDPMYEDAVRIVVEMGKASTSTLQRRLRLGYGRAARILDMMQRDGIIGPPDGSRPRDVLKAPDWLHEIEDQLR